MPSRPALLVLAAVLSSLAGCFKVERQSTTNQTVAAAWEGEWQGTWNSRNGRDAGFLRLAVQTFDRLPLLRVDTDNPCVRAPSYTFVRDGLQWELTGADGTRFVGTLDPTTRVLKGDYTCAMDGGTWQVAFVRELPQIGDVGGTWTGALITSVPPAEALFELELDQVWFQGSLRVLGELRVPGQGLRLPIREGRIEWQEGRFQLVLRTDPAAGPELWLQGVGLESEPRIEDGLLLVDDPRVPFRIGTWVAARLGD